VFIVCLNGVSWLQGSGASIIKEINFMTIFMIVTGVLAVVMLSYNMIRNEMRHQRIEKQLQETQDRYTNAKE